MPDAPSGVFVALLARARAGDADAFARLLAKYEQRLLGSIRAELGERLRERLESQDVLQQVYLDALHNLAQFTERGPDSFFAWLRSIALHRICDLDRRYFQSRKRGGEKRLADLYSEPPMSRLLNTLSPSGASPSAAADVAQREHLLRAALERLSSDQRQVIELRYLQQLNVGETAAKMERSENAVRSLCVRALIRLRELLADAIA
jgi:RNA polymerase sigma-70 factor (ECF subfamily)